MMELLQAASVSSQEGFQSLSWMSQDPLSPLSSIVNPLWAFFSVALISLGTLVVARRQVVVGGVGGREEVG
ncbi:hypothetical protein EYF80_013214 [Liparis tanakae]|uniref:Uncharacterized protein n=1 Tax=Liparis tanakae TaxID=230148 RepID=A0A4Z2IGK8_9TELE|nr:hypothetical protein EYF80_013214 [Liparis tanakae]